MKIVRAIEDMLKREVRTAMARDPLITITGMQEHLESRFGREFSFVYTRKLMNKVVGQARSEVDRARINCRIMQMRETHQLARERLLRVLYWTEGEKDIKKPLTRDIVEAAKNLVMLDIAVLNAEVANGLYKNLDEAAAQLKYPALPEEQRGQIVSTFQKWGILPPGSLVESVIIHAARAITPAE